MDGVRKLHSVSVIVLTTYIASLKVDQEINKERKIQNGARQD
jgi:hypothetical protein